MNIVIVGSSKFDSLEFHMADSLSYLGHKTDILDYFQVIPISNKLGYWVNYFSDAYAQYISKILIRKIIDYKPDLIIVTYRDVHPSFVSKVKLYLKNVPVIHYNPDQLTTLKNQQIFASDYDVFFSKDEYMVTFMRNKMALNAFYLSECFNQRYCQSDFGNKQIAEDNIQIEVLAYGNFYPYRTKMLDILVKNKLNITLCGVRGPYFSNILEEKILPPIYGKEKANYIFGSKIVFNNFHYAEVNAVNEKYFVINGSGGFQICDYTNTLEDFSPVDSREYSFKNIHEAVDMLKFYLSNPSIRLEIAEKQHVHFLNNHTYDIRMTEMLNILFK